MFLLAGVGKGNREPRSLTRKEKEIRSQSAISKLQRQRERQRNGGRLWRTPFLFTLTNSAGIASRLGKLPPRLSEWSKIRTMLTTWPGSIYVYTRRAPHWWPEGRARPPTSSNGAMMYVVRTWEPWMTSTMTAVSAGWRSQTRSSSLCNYSTCAAWTNTVNSLPPSK